MSFLPIAKAKAIFLDHFYLKWELTLDFLS